MLTRVIFNQKGGVGKSSIAVNLAAMSAHQGLRTLLIDLDPQCNATQYIIGDAATDIHPAHITEPNIENFFSQTLQATSSPMLADILQPLESKHKIYKLKDGLNLLTQQFDRVYIDTPPAFNFFTLSALIAADRVIVPFDCDIFSKRALQTLVQNILETRQDHNSDLLIEGIIVNQFDPRANLPKEVVQTLVNEGYPVYDTKLSPSIIMKQSHHQSLPLIYLDPKHKLTQQYDALYQEIESR